MKEKIGYSTAPSTQQPQGLSHQSQGLPQQPKQAPLKPTPPPSPAIAPATEPALPVPAAPAVATTSAAAASVVKQSVGHAGGNTDAAAPAQNPVPVSPAVAADPVLPTLQQARHVKAETASPALKRDKQRPGPGQDKQKVPAAAEAVPGNALQQADDTGAAAQVLEHEVSPSKHHQSMCLC